MRKPSGAFNWPRWSITITGRKLATSYARSFRLIVETLLNHPVDHLLEHRWRAIFGALEIRVHALLDQLSYQIDFNIHIVAGLLLHHDNLLLRIGNQHDLEPAFRIINVCHRKARAVDRNKAFLYDVAQDVRSISRRSWVEPEREGISVWCYRYNAGDSVDVALYNVASHSCIGTHGSF
jgi:hypothetical protein